MIRASDFFAYARERHSIHLRRAAGRSRSEWTRDPILQQYRFCNVFRELDRTTIWFRENVRDEMRDRPEVLLATVLFRWFNRIKTGEAIFSQESLGLGGEREGETSWEFLLRSGDVSSIRASALQYCGDGPYVTGSYIIKTPDGRNKLDGVLWCVEQFMQGDWREFALTPQSRPITLEEYWLWLRRHPFLGDFMAYEIVTDLRHTAQLDRAPDIMTWANPGPGAMRGLNRIQDRPLDRKVPKAQANREMRELLALSHGRDYWPNIGGANHSVPGDFSDWPAWEMRDVEHTLCEFDKYERARLGEGRPRQVFR